MFSPVLISVSDTVVLTLIDTIVLHVGGSANEMYFPRYVISVTSSDDKVNSLGSPRAHKKKLKLTDRVSRYRTLSSWEYRGLARAPKSQFILLHLVLPNSNNRGAARIAHKRQTICRPEQCSDVSQLRTLASTTSYPPPCPT